MIATLFLHLAERDINMLIKLHFLISSTVWDISLHDSGNTLFMQM